MIESVIEGMKVLTEKIIKNWFYFKGRIQKLREKDIGKRKILKNIIWFCWKNLRVQDKQEKGKEEAKFGVFNGLMFFL